MGDGDDNDSEGEGDGMTVDEGVVGVLEAVYGEGGVLICLSQPVLV